MKPIVLLAFGACASLNGPGEKLNARQEAFCREYIVDLCATKAAIRAGYSSNGASVTGSRLLTNAKIQEKISHLKREREQRTAVSGDRVVAELALIAFGDIRDAVQWDANTVSARPSAELSPDAAALVRGVRSTAEGTVVLTHDRIDALKTLLAHVERTTTGQDPEAFVRDLRETLGMMGRLTGGDLGDGAYEPAE